MPTRNVPWILTHGIMSSAAAKGGARFSCRAATNSAIHSTRNGRAMMCGRASQCGVTTAHAAQAMTMAWVGVK